MPNEEITDEQFVKSIYPDAKAEWLWLCGYNFKNGKFEKNKMCIIVFNSFEDSARVALTEIDAWIIAAEILKQQTLKRFES